MAEVAPGALAPEVPAVPASTDAPAPGATAAPETESPQGQEPEATPPEKTFTQSELNAIVAKEKAKESRRAERIARAEAERDILRQQLEARTQPPAAQAPGEPNPKDYPDFESYNRAMVKHLAKLEVEQILKGREQEGTAQREQRDATERAAHVRSKLNEGSEKYEDFEEVALNPQVPISAPMAAAISESDRPADVAYYLGSHLDDARRISQLPPTQQVREIAKIEAKLAAPPKTTQAPPPITPNSTQGKVARDLSDPSLSDAEWNATRRRQLAAKNGRA